MRRSVTDATSNCGARRPSARLRVRDDRLAHTWQTVSMFVRPADIAEKQKTRHPLLDNARFLAVVLVVIGHTVTLFPPSGVTQPAVLLLQTFRMPLLIIITGHLARNFVLNSEKVRGLVTKIAVPYLIFETLYSLRSEERRVGKEGRSRWAEYPYK